MEYMKVLFMACENCPSFHIVTENLYKDAIEVGKDGLECPGCSTMHLFKDFKWDTLDVIRKLTMHAIKNKVPLDAVYDLVEFKKKK